MKVATLIGLVLVVLGVVGFVTGGFSFTRDKAVVDAGPVQISASEKQSFPMSPVLSGIAVIGGIALIAVGAKSRG
jgi:hypothetical protein